MRCPRAGGRGGELGSSIQFDSMWGGGQVFGVMILWFERWLEEMGDGSRFRVDGMRGRAAQQELSIVS